jgi:N-acetyl-anhydromuramyl-L-alanine amidase AmpD
MSEVEHWETLSDTDILEVAKSYRLHRRVSLQQYLDNVQYLTNRLKTLGYELEVGCCGQNNLHVVQK